jgi:tripartite-type tricarboxylate transporter receptor subunit TctC
MHLNRIQQTPEVQARLDQLGLVKMGGSPEEFGQFIKAETDKLKMLIKTKRIEMMD